MYSVVGVLVEVIENVDRCRDPGLDKGVAALIPIHRLAFEVALCCQMQRLAPKAVRLAVSKTKDILVAADSVEGELLLFGHFD